MNFPIKKRYLLPIILVSAYFLGPKPAYPEFNGKIQALSIPLNELDSFVADKESKVPNIKPQNNAQIIWADSIRKTPYSVVYLHGFSASAVEGDPIHKEFAARYGCNMYLSRLARHGIEDDDSFKDLTPKALIDSAKEAIAIGKLLGEKVILLSCSTGGTLSVYLSAMNQEDIHAQILLSPNISIDEPATKLMAYPWGLQILRLANGSDYFHIRPDEDAKPFWTHTYRIEGLVALQNLLNETMTDEVFKKNIQPTFVGYYYKNEEECDHVVSVPAMKDYFSKIGTPEKNKRMIPFPNVGDHVVCSALKSQDLDEVRVAVFAFAEEILGLEKKHDKPSIEF
jgi:pimeloyl-ACP methyl ester carboxylesterase